MLQEITKNKFNIFNHTEFVNEMKERNQDGWILKKVNPILLRFQRCAEEKFWYKIELIDDYKFFHQLSKMKKHRIESNKEMGWIYLGHFAVFSVFAKRIDAEISGEEHQEPPTTEKLISVITEKVVFVKKMRILLEFCLILAMCLVVCEGMYQSNLQFTFELNMLLLLFAYLCISEVICCLFEIRKLKKYVSQLKEGSGL